eukprot:scaffold86121_cov63-Phaeocystis_antarctica.AAC.2
MLTAWAHALTAGARARRLGGAPRRRRTGCAAWWRRPSPRPRPRACAQNNNVARTQWRRLQPAGSPEAALSAARSCLRLPYASSSLDQSAAWSALGWPATRAWARERRAEVDEDRGGEAADVGADEGDRRRRRAARRVRQQRLLEGQVDRHDHRVARQVRREAAGERGHAHAWVELLHHLVAGLGAVLARVRLAQVEVRTAVGHGRGLGVVQRHLRRTEVERRRNAVVCARLLEATRSEPRWRAEGQHGEPRRSPQPGWRG